MDSNNFYLPETVNGISFLLSSKSCLSKENYKDYKEGEIYSLSDLAFSVTRNTNQGKNGLILNQARSERRPFFRYIYSVSDNLFFQEELPWLDYQKVKMLMIGEKAYYSIIVQIRLAIRWAAQKNIYNLGGLAIMIVPENWLINLPDRTIVTYGYIPIFTDFTQVSNSGNIDKELQRFSYPADKEEMIRRTIVFPPISIDNGFMMYQGTSERTTMESCNAVLVQSLFSRAHVLFQTSMNSFLPKDKFIYLIQAKGFASLALKIHGQHSLLYPRRDKPGAYEEVEGPKVGNVYEDQQTYLNAIMMHAYPQFELRL